MRTMTKEMLIALAEGYATYRGLVKFLFPRSGRVLVAFDAGARSVPTGDLVVWGAVT